nr:hypothetical protein [Nocardioides agariphilus]
MRAGRLTRRLVQLLVGLVMYGVSVAMMVRGGLGVAPWDVLTSGFVRHVSISFGQAVIAISFVVLLFWLPLRETPGIGTLANAFLIGLSADATLAVLSQPASLVPRAGLMLGGIALCGLATAVYIGAQLGRGPRDGLMTGLARRTGLSLRLVRTALEVTVVLVGVALGGQLGIGTVLFAVTIGPIAQALLPVFLVSVRGD